MIKRFILLSTVLLALVAFAPMLQASEYKPTDWKELIPEGYSPPPIRSQAYYDANPDQFGQPDIGAPMVEALDQKKVKIPGYIVQLEGDAEKVTQFLLVPYFGACVHVPPPPPNQIILVDFPEGVKYEDTFDAVWVEGTIRVQRIEGELAVVGYAMEAATVTSYY